MPKQPNRLLRVLVPVIVVVAGIGIAIAIVGNTSRHTPTATPATASANTTSPANPAQPPTAAPATTTSDQQLAGTEAQGSTPAAGGTNAADQAREDKSEATRTGAADGASASAGAPNGGATTSPQSASATYRARSYAFAGYDNLGDLTARDKGGQYEMRLTFSALGAGVGRLELANHYQTIEGVDHEVLQQFVQGGVAAHLGLVAFAADRIEIGDPPVSVGLYGMRDSADRTYWNQTAPGAFEALVEDGEGKLALKLTRRFVLAPGSFDFRIEQTIENLSNGPLLVRWHQHGPQDLPLGIMRYGGDVRRVRFGYLLPLSLDPAQIVQGDDSAASFMTHAHAVEPDPTLPKVLWPNEDSRAKNLRLVWGATTGRYFTVAVYSGAAGAGGAGQPTQGTNRAFENVETVDRVALPMPQSAAAGAAGASLVLRLAGKPITLGAGRTADVSIGAFAGPASRKVLESPKAASADWHGLPSIVVYTFGGPCGFCTFQPIAVVLEKFLTFLHDRVLGDWALAIMFLVVCVRTLLHPVTRWSQNRMTRFGKSLAKMAPKQKAIQEKYKNDPVKMREEQAKLMREEKIDYFGVLGCVPMFLQTPIWIALYAMLFFFVELRHTPAFFGVVQAATGGKWWFLGDLAEPDNFLNFHQAFGASPDGFHIPLLSSLMGPIQGINILPLVLGVVFYIQQKYMTPPPTGAMTPEQEQQQKIMKVMTVVMFPLFMYNAPAGLSLYFMTNSTLGIFESKWIRSHAEKKIAEEEANEVAAGVGTSMWDRKNKAPEKKGFLQRLQEAALARQKEMEEKKKAAQKKQGKR